MNRELINQELSELADYTCNEVYLSLCKAIEYLKQSLPVLGDQSLPEAKSREKEEVDLNELFDKFPCLNNDEFIKSYWEDFDLGVKVDNFYFQVHQRIKRILVEFYFESINILEGDQLRFIDCQLYYMASVPFSQDSLRLKFHAKEPDKNPSHQSIFNLLQY